MGKVGTVGRGLNNKCDGEKKASKIWVNWRRGNRGDVEQLWTVLSAEREEGKND